MKAIDKDKLMAEIATIDLTERKENGFNACVECIECMPTMEIPKWIPVGERLPQLNEEVLVTSTECSDVLFAEYKGIIADRPLFKHISGIFGIDNVIAWMPLPEAYKESE